MSGIEVISLIASVTQLTRYVINIREFIQEVSGQVQSGPQGLEQLLGQLDRVLDTVREIEENTLFHTPSIERHLEAIVVQVESLQTVLGKLGSKKPQSTWKKYWKAYIRIRAKKQIFAIFTKIEEEKTTLQLSMTRLNATISSRTNSDLSQNLLTTQDTYGAVQEIRLLAVGKNRQLESLIERLSREGDSVPFSQGTFQNPGDVMEMGIVSTIDDSAQAQGECAEIPEDEVSQDPGAQCSIESARVTELVPYGSGTKATIKPHGIHPEIPLPLLVQPRNQFNHTAIESTASLTLSTNPTIHPTSAPTPSLPSSGTSSSSRTSSSSLSSLRAGHDYNKNESSNGGMQMNGDVGACGQGFRLHRYDGNKAMDGGKQINGNTSVDFAGLLFGPRSG